MRRVALVAACACCFGSVAVAVGAGRSIGHTTGTLTQAPGIWANALAPALAIGFLAYLLAGYLADSWPLVASVGLATQLLPLAGPLILSGDAQVYGAYGDLALHGRNPYVYASPDNLFPSVYGPLFTILSEPVRWVLGARAEFGFRILAALSVLAIMAFASLLARRRAPALALVGLNPLVALHYAGGGHNDALMVALALGGLILSGRSRWAAAGSAWAASVFVKWISGTLFVLLVAARRVRASEIVAFAVTCLALSMLGTAFYGSAWLDQALTIVKGANRNGSIGIAHWLEAAGLGNRGRTAGVALIQLSALALLAWRAWVRRLRLGLAAGVLAGLQSWLNPWYALWPVGFAAADDDDRAGRILALALTGYLLLDVVRQ